MRTLLLLGVFAYKEPFELRKLATFLLIWLALGIYSWDSIRTQKHRSMQQPTDAY